MGGGGGNGASNRILVILTALSDPFMGMLSRSYFPYLELAHTETHTAFYYPTHSPSPVLFMWMCVLVSH